MYLFRSLLRSSTVDHAVCGRFRSGQCTDVVLSRGGSLELYGVGPNGQLWEVRRQSVFGTVWEMRTIPMKKADCEELNALVLLTDSGNVSFIAFDTQNSRFTSIAQAPLFEARDFNPGDGGGSLCVSRDGSVIAVSSETGHVACLPVSAATALLDMDVKHKWVQMWATFKGLANERILGMCFVYEDGERCFKDIAVLLRRKSWFACEICILRWREGSNTLVEMKDVTVPANGGCEDLPIGKPVHIDKLPHKHDGFIVIGTCGIGTFEVQYAPSSASGGTQTDPMAAGPTVDLVPSMLPLLDVQVLPCRRLLHWPSTESSALQYLRLDKALGLDAPLRSSSSPVALCGLSSMPATLLEGAKDMVLSYSWASSSLDETADRGSAQSQEENQGCNECVLLLGMVTGVVHRMVFLYSRDTGTGRLSQQGYHIDSCLCQGIGPASCILSLPGGGILCTSVLSDGTVLWPQDANPSALQFQTRGCPPDYIPKFTLSNMAPVHDIAVLQQASTPRKVYAACGSGPSGSIRAMQMGQSVTELYCSPQYQGASQYQGVTGMWSIKENEDDQVHRLLVMTFPSATRALGTGQVFSDVTHRVSIIPSLPTLACGRLANGFIAQVTPQCVVLCSLEGLHWEDDKEEGDEEVEEEVGLAECMPDMQQESCGLDECMRTCIPEDSLMRWQGDCSSSQQPLAAHTLDFDGLRLGGESAFRRLRSTSTVELRYRVLGGRSSCADDLSPEDIWRPPAPADGGLCNGDEPSCSGISVGAVAERMVVVFCSETRLLWVLGLDDTEQEEMSGSSGGGRKRGREHYELQAWPDPCHINSHPSCMHLIPEASLQRGSGRGWFCIIGSYEPSIIVHRLNRRDRSVNPLHSVLGPQLCVVSLAVHESLGIALMDRLEMEGAQDRQGSLADGAQPVPESIITVQQHQHTDGEVHCLVGFRNGMLGEFSISDASIKCLSSRYIGMIPVGLTGVMGDLVLALSDRAFLLSTTRGKCQATVSPLDFPVGCVAAAAVAVDPAFESAGLAGDLTSSKVGEACRMGGAGLPLVACCDRDGNLRLLSLMDTPLVHPLQCTPHSMMPIPHMGKLLLLCSDGTDPEPPTTEGMKYELRLFNPQDQVTDASYTLKDVAVTSTCLWPLATGAENMFDGSGDWLATGFGSPIWEAQEDLDGFSVSSSGDAAAGLTSGKRGASATASSEPSGIQTCLSAVKGVAAALTCCTFNRPANGSSPCSSPREFPGPCWHEPSSQEVFVVVGTRVHQNGDLQGSNHQGDLYLLRIAPSQAQCTSSTHQPCCKPWEFTVISRKRMPDPVTAIAPMGDNRLIVSVGPRIVCYTIALGKWQRKGWSPWTLDMVTHLSACPSSWTVAVGDRFHSVVLFQYEENNGEGSFKEIFSDPKSRPNADVLIARKGWAVTGIDTNGCFCVWSPLIQKFSPIKSLQPLAMFNTGEPLRRVAITRIGNRTALPVDTGFQDGLLDRKRSMLVAGALGGLFLFAQIPKALYRTLVVAEAAIGSHPETQPLAGGTYQAHRHCPIYPGGCSGDSWERVSSGVVDGDLISDFLEAPDAVQGRVLDTIPLDVVLDALDMEAAPAEAGGNEDEWKRAVIMHVIQNVMCTAI